MPAPARDWSFLLALASIALAALVVWHLSLYSTVLRGGTLGSAHTAPVFSTEALDSVQQIFSARAAEEAKYQTGSYRYADPSQ